MSKQLTAYVTSFGDAGFIAGVTELPGMVEQATSPEGAVQKLILALKIRTSFVEKIDISQINITVEPKDSGDSSEKNKSQRKKELNLVLQS